MTPKQIIAIHPCVLISRSFPGDGIIGKTRIKIVRLLKHTSAIGDVSLILGMIPYIDANAIPLITAKILPVILCPLLGSNKNAQIPITINNIGIVFPQRTFMCFLKTLYKNKYKEPEY